MPHRRYPAPLESLFAREPLVGWLARWADFPPRVGWQLAVPPWDRARDWQPAVPRPRYVRVLQLAVAVPRGWRVGERRAEQQVQVVAGRDTGAEWTWMERVGAAVGNVRF